MAKRALFVKYYKGQRSTTGRWFLLDVPSSVFIIILICKIPCKIVNLLRKCPITLSTWIRTAAISWVSSTDFCSSWDFPRVDSRSPGSTFFSRPQFSVRHTSGTCPPQGLEVYDIVPCGVIPTKSFTVLLLLYEEYVWALAVRSDGFSMKISKQSMITEHFGKDSRKQGRSIFQSSSLLGHVTKTDNWVTNIGNHLCKIRETEDWVIPNLYPRSCSSNPSLIKIMFLFLLICCLIDLLTFQQNHKLNQILPRLVSPCKSTVYFHLLQQIYNFYCRNLISTICVLTGNNYSVLTIFYALLQPPQFSACSFA